MPNIAGPYTVDVDGGVGPMTLAVDNQGNLVNSTIGQGSRFIGPDILTGTFNSATNELLFTQQSRLPHPSFWPSWSYKDYIVMNQAPSTSFTLVGVVDRTVLVLSNAFLAPGVVEAAWIASPGSPAVTGGTLASRKPPSQGYALIMNGQVRNLGISLDAQNNLISVPSAPETASFIDNSPIKGNFDPQTGKLAFNAVIQPFPIAIIDSFFGYMLAMGGFVLAGITNRIVVDTTGGAVTITNTETGWWAIPNPQ
jgi:hypothetical protein